MSSGCLVFCEKEERRGVGSCARGKVLRASGLASESGSGLGDAVPPRTIGAKSTDRPPFPSPSHPKPRCRGTGRGRGRRPLAAGGHPADWGRVKGIDLLRRSMARETRKSKGQCHATRVPRGGHGGATRTPCGRTTRGRRGTTVARRDWKERTRQWWRYAHQARTRCGEIRVNTAATGAW